MKQTSLLAWQSVSVLITQRQAQVLTALREVGGRATMHKIAMHMRVPLNTISGRFSELEKKGYIDAVEIERQDGYHPRTVYQANCYVSTNQTAKQLGGGTA